MAVKELTSADFEQAVKGNEIALFDFFATLCGPCKAFSPIFDKVADENPDIFFGKIDIDKPRTSPTQPTCRPSPRS